MENSINFFFFFFETVPYSDFRESSRTKSQFLKEFKSQILSQFLRLGSEFSHMISIFIEFQTLNSNMVSPLLIS